MRARSGQKQETGNVVEIENGTEDETRGGTDDGPDIGMELQASGNYDGRFRVLWFRCAFVNVTCKRQRRHLRREKSTGVCARLEK